MPLIPFPDIPAVGGVPLIPRSLSEPPVGRLALGVLQGILWRSFQIDLRWGIFDKNGKSLGNPQSFLSLLLSAIGIGQELSTKSVEYSKETRISDFPVERGGFAAYNKVELPAEARVTLCLSGSESDRQAFLVAIDTAVKSTDFYSVVTPEVTYINYSIEYYNYQRRNDRGANLLIVELGLKEIREVSATVTAKQAQSVSASTPEDNGKVQPQVPDKSTLKRLSELLP